MFEKSGKLITSLEEEEKEKENYFCYDGDKKFIRKFKLDTFDDFYKNKNSLVDFIRSYNRITLDFLKLTLENMDMKIDFDKSIADDNKKENCTKVELISICSDVSIKKRNWIKKNFENDLGFNEHLSSKGKKIDEIKSKNYENDLEKFMKFEGKTNHDIIKHMIDLEIFRKRCEFIKIGFSKKPCKVDIPGMGFTTYKKVEAIKFSFYE